MFFTIWCSGFGAKIQPVSFVSENLLEAQHLRETPVMPLPGATLVFIPQIFHPRSQACQSDQLPSVGYRLGGSKGPMTGPRQFIWKFVAPAF